MSTAIARRLGVVLAALSVAALPAISQGSPVEAASTGTLFGLGGRSSIITIDPASGASSTFVNLPTVTTFPGASYNALASDAGGHRLFTVRTVFEQLPNPPFFSTTFQLVTVNTKDPTATPSVSPDMTSGITQLVFDPSTLSLFGQTNTFTNTSPFQLVRIDPATGAQTHVADIPGVQPLKMAVAPAKHALYFPTESFVLGQFQPVVTLVTVDTTTGSLSQSPPLATGLFGLAYDTSSGVLFGKTFCCPANVVTVDPVTGAETRVAGNLGLGGGIAIDSSSHTIFMTDDQFGAFGFNQFIDSVNDQSGAISVSTGALPTNTFVNELAFEGIATTAESIKQDVRTALASGAIDNAGVASSLLAELDAAGAARSRGQCSTAANIYQAFINEVTAQSRTVASGVRPHIAASTAVQLIGEAHFLIANCP